MKSKLFPLLIAVASGFLMVGCGTTHQCCTTAQVTQWEYKVVNNLQRGTSIADFVDPEIDPKLTTLGGEGWELVAFTNDRWIFKRAKKAN